MTTWIFYNIVKIEKKIILKKDTKGTRILISDANL